MSFFNDRSINLPLLKAAAAMMESGDRGQSTATGISRGLLGYAGEQDAQKQRATAKEQADFDRKFRMSQQAKIDAETKRFNNPTVKDRRITKGADGFNYFDDGTRAFPNVDVQGGPLDTGPFENIKDQLGAFKSIRGEFDKTNASNKKRRDTFGTVTDLVRLRGGWDKLQGADDTLLAKSFANMVLPNESVMGDDMELINQQGGFAGLSKNMVAKLVNGDTLDPTERAIMYETMKSIHNSAVKGYEENKVRAYPDVKRSGMGYGEIFQDHAIPYDAPIPANLVIDPNSSDSTFDPNAVNASKSEWGY